jgi:hypothetical protein
MTRSPLNRLLRKVRAHPEGEVGIVSEGPDLPFLYNHHVSLVSSGK